jgi:hypothetical protein
MTSSENSAEPFSRPIEVLLPDKSTAVGKLLLWDSDPDNPKVARITLQLMGREFSSRNVSYNHALNDIRRQLENDGILLKCYGSSRNVWPSSVTSGMGRGGEAYRLYLGKKGERKDVVSIFDSGSNVDACTLAEQEEFHKQWLLSVGISPGKRHYPWKAQFFQSPVRTAMLFLKEKLSK